MFRGALLQVARGEPAAFDRARRNGSAGLPTAFRQSALLPDVRESLAALQRLRPHAITLVRISARPCNEAHAFDAAELSSTG